INRNNLVTVLRKTGRRNNPDIPNPENAYPCHLKSPDFPIHCAAPAGNDLAQNLRISEGLKQSEKKEPIGR
ncbi:hypothetical protein SAMN05421757_103503, partial [Tropicimonas sediminicola]